MTGKHHGGVESLVKFLLSHQSLFENYVINGAVGFESLLSHLGRGFVAYVGVEGSDDADGVLDHSEVALLIDRDAEYALPSEGLDGFLEPDKALEEGLGDDGFHNVEL